MKRGLILLFSAMLGTASLSYAGSGNLKLIIDAGHGGTDVGSKSKAGDKESDICLQIAEAIQDYAKENGIATEMTRTRKKETLSFDQRSGHKAEPGVKTFYISVHFDEDKKDPSVHGARVRYSDHAHYSNESRKLAQAIAQSLDKINNTPTKIETVDAIVFMKNDMPAIMVEPGRMNSAQDVKNIKEKDYRKEVAMYIVQAAMNQ